MDSNGRHRPSASTSSSSVPTTTVPALSGSSTFRRLPSLARPFRRNTDKDKGKETSGDRDTIVEEAEGGGSSSSGGHQRTSTFPSLSRVLGDSSSPAPSSNHSTPFSTPTSRARPSEDTAPSSSSLWPPSRKSSLLTSTSPPPQIDTPVTHPPLSPFLRKESMRDAMNAAMAPPIPVLSSQSLDDMGHVTYPSHLAQRLPPEAGPGPSTTSTAASTPVSATPIVAPSAMRAISRTRDFTMGTPIRAVHDRERSNSKDAQMPNGEELGPEPGPGGPPTGVPRRKESIQASTSANDTSDRDRARETNGNGESRRLEGRSRLVSKNGVGESEHDTDSGGGENFARQPRRRATTKSASDRPRDLGASGGKDDTPTPTSGEKDTTPRIRKSSKTHVTMTASSSNPSSSSGTSRPILPCARGMSRVPASSMYFSLLPYHGRPPAQPLRAHTGTLVGDRIWIIGGVDAKHCWRGVAWYDTESLLWTTVETAGETLPPLRAHTTTAVGDKLYVFGGGDGPTYSNEVWSFDTTTHRFSKPNIATPITSWPPPRRAHTTVLYRNFLVVFGGGNGQAALNDVWALDISDPTRLTWQEWPTKGNVPQRKGYHTSNLVGDKMVVFGGSDGHASFADVHVLNLRTLTWTAVNTDVKHNRLSHTSTQVGSYLFILGGHTGQTYAQDVLLFNLVTLQWEIKVPRGQPPPGRGYHVALLHDARIFISGGYNGVAVFDDLWALDLSAAAYLPQVTTFEVDETGGLDTAPAVDVRA